MANQKPLLSINKFSGAGLNGILYCDGFYPEIDNGKSVMGEGFYTGKLFNSTTTGFSELANEYIYASISLTTIANRANVYNLFIDNGVYQHIYAYQDISDETKDGVIYKSATTEYCSKPDLIETNLGNILFPSEKYIGKGIRFAATGGSTTTIADATKNFVTLGVAVNDKVTNLKTGVIYTITSITNGSGTNDVLNFSASGASTTSAGDECIAWVADQYETNISKQVWQPNQTDWAKQFKIYGDEYLFTNGNYLGKISADESTVDKTYKQLPAKHQALCFDTNNEQILVSTDKNGRGIFLLWDGYTSGWNNQLEFDSPVTSIISYKSGWVFVSSGTVYYTDGYQIQTLYDINQTRKLSTLSIQTSSLNGLVIYRDVLYIANNVSDSNFIKQGVYVIDLANPNNGFTVVKCLRETRGDGVPYSLSLSNRFSNYQIVTIGGNSFVGTLNTGSPVTKVNKSLIIHTTLPEPRRITGIGLNIGRILKYYSDDINFDKTREVQVSIGDGERGIISYLQATSAGGTTDTFTVNGTVFLNHEVGDELEYLNTGVITTDTPYGERTFITSITNKGTNAENWTVSPALSGNVAVSADMRAIRVKKLDRKTITYRDLEKEIMFYNPNTGFLSNKLFIEIVLFGGAVGQTYPLPLNINEIKVYGD